MKFSNQILDYISDACSRKARIVLVLKENEEWYEGVVERIYNGGVIKFAAFIPGRGSAISGFLLVSDILDVIY